jgi:hypothetical protein
MSQREIWINCLQSFYRERHGLKKRFKDPTKLHHKEEMVRVHRRYCEMVRYYIKKIRGLDGQPEKGEKKG